MINNLVAPARDNKGEGLGGKIAGDASKSGAGSGKEVFGLIFQSLQEKGGETKERPSDLISEANTPATELTEENSDESNKSLNRLSADSENAVSTTKHQQNADLLLKSGKNTESETGKINVNDQESEKNPIALNDSNLNSTVDNEGVALSETGEATIAKIKQVSTTDSESGDQADIEAERNNKESHELVSPQNPENEKVKAGGISEIIPDKNINSNNTPFQNSTEESVNSQSEVVTESSTQISVEGELKISEDTIRTIQSQNGPKEQPVPSVGIAESSDLVRKTVPVDKPGVEGQAGTVNAVNSELNARDVSTLKTNTLIEEQIPAQDKPASTVNTKSELQSIIQPAVHVTGEKQGIKATIIPKSESTPAKDNSLSQAEQVKLIEPERAQPEVSLNFKGDLRTAPLRQESLRNITNGLPNSDFYQKPGSTPVQLTEESAHEVMQEKLVNNGLVSKASASVLGNGIVAENIQATQVREKKYGTHISNFEDRNGIFGESSRGRQIFEAEPLFKLSGLSQAPFKTTGIALLSEMKVSDEEIFWKDYSTNASQVKENKNSDMQIAGFSRLMEIPVYNFSVRRNLLQSISQAVTKTVSGGQSSSETWQKHNFTIEDGKNFQVSVRQADGIVYLKLNSSMGELNRLLQQHQNEIREYLERECNLKVDLQFDGEQNQDLSQFFGGSGSGKKGFKSFSPSGSTKNFTKTDAETIQKSIRKFGYNRMEWMA